MKTCIIILLTRYCMDLLVVRSRVERLSAEAPNTDPVVLVFVQTR